METFRLGKTGKVKSHKTGMMFFFKMKKIFSNKPGRAVCAVRLDPSHKKQLGSIIKNRWSLFQKDALDNMDMFLNPNAVFPALFGVFTEGKLFSVLGLSKWPVLPYATFCYRFSCVESGAFFNRPLHNLCVKRALEYGGKHGIKAYYLFQKRRSRGLYPRIYKDLPELKNWFAFTEAVIPANTKPEENAYWLLMDKIIRPYEGEIRRFQPKPAFSDSVYWPED